MILHKHSLPAGVFLLALLALLSFMSEDKSGKLTVAFLDVGQGDAIFIESPTGIQVLVDGGPEASVTRELGEILSWRDRTIDLLVVSNPDEDHIRGFLDVLARFDVAALMEPGTKKDTVVYKNLLQAVDEEGAKRITAKRGMSFDVGGGVHIDILFPDRNVGSLEPNTGSLVARLMYGSTNLLLMGDSTESVENYLVEIDGAGLASDLLKVGHHGSRTSTGEQLLAVVHPTIAVISAGKENKYGHPHAEVLEHLRSVDIETLITAQEGTVIFESDGKTWERVR